MIRFPRLAAAGLCLGLALAPAARAQEAAPPLPDDPRAPRFEEVERGFHVGFEAGYLTFFKTPLADPARHRFAPADGGASSGLAVGVSAGYDLTDRLALSLFVLGSHDTASASYGSFSTLAVGGDARFAFFGSRDRYGTERLLLYVHGRGGYMVTRPLGPLRRDRHLPRRRPGAGVLHPAAPLLGGPLRRRGLCREGRRGRPLRDPHRPLHLLGTKAWPSGRRLPSALGEGRPLRRGPSRATASRAPR